MKDAFMRILVSNNRKKSVKIYPKVSLLKRPKIINEMTEEVQQFLRN